MKSFALLFALFLMGCTSGSGSGGNSVSKPAATPEMTRSATHGMAVVQKLLEIKEKSQVSHPQPFAKLFLNRFVASQQTRKPSFGNPDETARKLEKSLNPDDCVFDLPKDEKPKEPGNGIPDPKEMNVRVAITGEQCPLNALIEVKVDEQVGEKFEGIITMTFAAKSEDMQLELGAKNARIDGRIGGFVRPLPNKGAEFGVAIEMKGGGELLTDGSFETLISYGTEGRITPPPENSNQPPNFEDIIQVSFHETQLYDFKNNSSRLGSTMTMKGLSAVATYQVNGNEVTQEEYQEYSSGLNLPGGIQAPGDDGHANPGPAPIGTPMMCSTQIYDAAQVSLEDLKKYLSGQGQPAADPIMARGICRSSGSWGMPHKDRDLTLTLNQFPEFIQMEISRAGNVKSFFAQRDDQTMLVDQHEDVTFLFVCMPVQECQF